MPILLKAMYRLNTISIKIPMALFAEMEMPILKFIMEWQGTPNSKNNLEKKRTKLEDSHFLIPNIS